ncbi:MAG: PPC domain-containing DNA-binding protein [Planctomycetota bacterium]|jgi:predicted DNA-binding protein with PD1-like motif
MKKLVLILACLVVINLAYSQKTQIQVTKPTTKHDDSKPNSKDVPEVMTLTDRFERIVVVRFKFNTDLLEGLEKAVEKDRIRNAVILSGIGSLRSYHVHGVSNRDFPSENFYMKDPDHPADLLNINGYVIDGRVHAHVTLADDDKAFGGHLEKGTNVFTFAVITVGVFSDEIDLSRVDDKTYR